MCFTLHSLRVYAAVNMRAQVCITKYARVDFKKFYMHSYKGIYVHKNDYTACRLLQREEFRKEVHMSE